MITSTCATTARQQQQLRIEEARSRRGGTPGGKPGGKRDPNKGQSPQQEKKTPSGHSGPKPPQHGQPKGGGAAAPGSSPLPSGLQRRPSEQALDIQFGKIAVPAQAARLGKKGGKNLVGLLQKAEEKERRLKELQASEDGKEAAEAILWRDALKSAHGEKVLDNPKVGALCGLLGDFDGGSFCLSLPLPLSLCVVEMALV